VQGAQMYNARTPSAKQQAAAAAAAAAV